MPAPPCPGGAGRRREQSGKSLEQEERRGGSFIVQVRPRAGPGLAGRRRPCASRAPRLVRRLAGAGASGPGPYWRGSEGCTGHPICHWLGGLRRPSLLADGGAEALSTSSPQELPHLATCVLWAEVTVCPLVGRPGTPAAIGWQGTGPRHNIPLCVGVSWRPGLDGGRQRLVGSEVSCGEAAAPGVTLPGPLPFRAG